MARLSTPPLDALHDRASRSPGQAVPVDTLTTATYSSDGSDGHTLVVSMGAAEPQGLTLTARYTDPRTVRVWVIAPTGSAPDGQPVPLDQRWLARANRLLAPDALSLQRDWHTKTHALRYGYRKVVALTTGEAIIAERHGSDWTAHAVPAGSATAAPQMAPLTPETPPQAEAAPGAAETAPAADLSALQTDAVLDSTPPMYQSEIVLDKGVRKTWESARKSHQRGAHKVVAMIGPSGAGKTHAVHSLAHSEGLPVIKFDASGVVEPGDWFGTVVLDNGRTRFVPSDLLRALEQPGARVLLLDEMNRANLRALNALLPVLDGSGTVTIPQTGRQARIVGDVMVAITANMGSQYLGVEPLDEAIRTRIGVWLEVDHLSYEDEWPLLMRRVSGLSEYDAQNLARFGQVVREASANNAGHAPVSTRQLLAAADLIVDGLPARDAVERCVLDGYSPEGGTRSDRAKVRTHLSGIEWKAKRTAGDEKASGAPDGYGPSTWTRDATTGLCAYCGESLPMHRNGWCRDAETRGGAA